MRIDDLIDRPSFLRGVARVFDFGAVLGRGSGASSGGSPEEADARALWGDWQAVAGDMGAAFRDTTLHVRGGRHAGKGEG